jgi:hypothetical protein
LPINPTVRTDTIAGKSSAQSRETLTDQTTDETITQQLADFGITNEERKGEGSATGDTQEALTGYVR